MAQKDPDPRISRREFLEFLASIGGAAAVAAFLEGCSKVGTEIEVLLTPTSISSMPGEAATPKLEPSATSRQPEPTATETNPDPTPNETGEDNLARLAFVKTNDRAEGVRRAIALLGINPVGGKNVFLKPNFNSADPAPGSTHPDVLVALIEEIHKMGAKRITVGDRSGMGNTRRVMQDVGVFDLAGMMDFDTMVFDELGPEDWVMVRPQGGVWRDGFPFAKVCLEAEAVVQTCCLKTHRFGGHFTMSLKNSVGLVAKRIPGEAYNYMDELHSSPQQRRMIAEINSAYVPALIVMDGVEAFISGGPDRGERVHSEVILAGTDRIALDAAGVAILRYYGCQTEAGLDKIFRQDQIARAIELGLGVDGPEKIKFLSDDPESVAYSEEIKAILLEG